MSSNGKANHDEMYAWDRHPRWHGITRPYSWSDVERLRGSLQIECTLARRGAKLWDAAYPTRCRRSGAHREQAVQQVGAGLKAIYVSGWQVAADANETGEMYPDQSLYPSDSVRR